MKTLSWNKEMSIIEEAHWAFLNDDFIDFWVRWEDNGASYQDANQSGK